MAQSESPENNGAGVNWQTVFDEIGWDITVDTPSNVNVVEELVNMIETQRAYEMNSKAIATTDQMLEYITNQL